ncbi:MAG TPA: STAS/SEC14 domain-containing protein [Reyranella sp.]|nr:STAS/SEC14 domain-containing protein [Reyranella sp.]
MPFRPKFLRAEKVVLIEGEGEITTDDIATCLRFVDAQGAHRYRKLIDARRVTNEVSDKVADGLVSLARSREALGASGGLALVMRPGTSLRRLAERTAEGAPAHRPVRVFDTFEEAWQWLSQIDSVD